MIPEIGDKFIINWKGMIKTYPGIKMCYFPDLEFAIDRFSKSGISVYYSDNRTNKKCKCSICSNNNTEKCIGIHDIIISQKKVSIDRSRKLKKLGI
jgi:hypothetical protein